MSAGPPAPGRGRAQGYVFWKGASPHDGAPIVLIVTGFRRPTKNAKTGNILQSWILRQDILPHEAVNQGLDASVCNDCPLRPAKARERGEKGSLLCYVRSDSAPSAIWRAFKAGSYPDVSRKRRLWPALLAGRKLRLGSYGNVSNIPSDVVERMCSLCDGHSGYDHCWDSPRFKLGHLVMASVSSVEEKQRANALGLRTYRILRDGEEPLPDERECPSRHGVTCDQCLACHGTRGTPGKVGIWIREHGGLRAIRLLQLNLIKR